MINFIKLIVNKLLLTLILFFNIVFIGISQKMVQSNGVVIDSETKNPISYCQIKYRNKNIITDINGNFSITTNYKLDTIHFIHYQYDGMSIVLDSTLINKKLEINLNKINYKKSEELDKLDLKKIINTLKNSDPNNKGYSISEYSKISIGTDNNEIVADEFKDLLITYIPKLPKNINNKHYLLLMESLLKTQYLNKDYETKKIIQALISGTDNPSALGIALLGLPSFILFQQQINILGAGFSNPMLIKNINKYKYFIEDTLINNNQKYVRISFENNFKIKLNNLKGYFLLDLKTKLLKSILLEPEEKNSKRSTIIIQEFQIKNKLIYPLKTKFKIIIPNLIIKDHYVVANLETIYFHINDSTNFNKRDIKLNGIEINDLKDQNLIDSIRIKQKIFLDTLEQNTYVFYDSIGKINNLSKMINSAYKVYYGNLPLGKFDFKLRKLISYNDVENFRLGIGLGTNSKFSKKHIFNTYFAYGTRDDKIKFGIGYQFDLLETKKNYFEINYSHDYKEPAGIDFRFVNNQFSSERLRNFRISRFDFVNNLELASINQINNIIKIGIGLNYQKIIPQYKYYENNVHINELEVIEAEISAKFAYGEKFIALNDYKTSLGSRWPILYINIIKTIPQYNQYQYAKLKAKLFWNKNWSNIGTISINLESGNSFGNLPYQKMYHARGSFAEISFFTQNSFEAMTYNEFLSDKFIHLFSSLQLPKFYKSNGKSLPLFMIINNIGYGTLSETNKNKLSIGYKKMEKTYFESGLIIKNIIKINIYALKFGLGAGLITRYGAYSISNKIRGNTVVKISLNAWI